VLSGGYDLGDAVEGLNAHLQLDVLFKLKAIIFVFHSMGGILVRQLLVTRQATIIENALHVGLFLVARPSVHWTGTKLFGVRRELSARGAHSHPLTASFYIHRYCSRCGRSLFRIPHAH
jgi:hypothetical protein